MANYEIESGIPLPEDKEARLKRLRQKLPFDKLEVGQSFVVKGFRESFDAIDLTFRPTKDGKRFDTKPFNEGGETVQRIWRTT